MIIVVSNKKESAVKTSHSHLSVRQSNNYRKLLKLPLYCGNALTLHSASQRTRHVSASYILCDGADTLFSWDS